MDHIGLYYPYIDPPESWIKCNLLLFDKISTIAREEDVNTSDMLHMLYLEGLWEPTLASSIDHVEYREEIVDLLLTFADRERYRLPSHSSMVHQRLTRMMLGKLSYSVEEALTELELCHRLDGALYVHEEVAAAVLAVTAKHTAAANNRIDSRLVTSTDLPRIMEYALDPIGNGTTDSLPRRRRQQHNCREILLEGVLPTPGELVSIPEIVDFRTRFRDEVMNFRQHLDMLSSAVTSSQDPLEALQSAKEGIEYAVENLRSASRGRLMLGVSSMSLVATTVALTNQQDPELAHWIFDGIGTAATGSIVNRAVRGRPRGNPLAYLVRARRRFGS